MTCYEIKDQINPLLICFRAEGGPAAEKAERERWIAMDHQKIMDSVNGEHF